MVVAVAAPALALFAPLRGPCGAWQPPSGQTTCGIALHRSWHSASGWKSPPEPEAPAPDIRPRRDVGAVGDSGRTGGATINSSFVQQQAKPRRWIFARRRTVSGPSPDVARQETALSAKRYWYPITVSSNTCFFMADSPQWPVIGLSNSHFLPWLGGRRTMVCRI